MRLLTLAQLNFRNLRDSRLEFPAGVVAVVGRNATGKSNLLAAAYLGCTGEVVGGKLVRQVRLGEEEAYVAAEVEHDEGVSRIEVGLAPGRKLLKVDGQQARTMDVARVVSAVLLTPEDADLIHGPPSGRRGYLDGLLSKLSARYSSLHREYLRVLEQRNALLRAGDLGPTFGVWSERFALLGSEIDALRDRAITRLAPLAAAVYREVAGDAGSDLRVSLRRSYAEAGLAEALSASARTELARAQTVVGPHRDDLHLELGGVSLHEYGSRGEARTAALALRVAEYRILGEKHAEPPVLLIDDFTAELDSARREYLLTLAGATPQAFVSGTEPPPRFDYRLDMVAGRATAPGVGRA
ncbi:MAG TPA: DNA replication and repair protein RecF [Trueperaceae bacterium]|nr:DNA replication and repair protein RecF [Trueperaceae bacterium]